MKIELNGLALTIDERTGGILGLSFPATGDILRAPSQAAGLLDLAYPIEAFPPLRLASQFSKARIVKEDGGVRILWDELAPSRQGVPRPPGAVRAEVAIKPSADGRSTVMSCRIENRTDSSIPQVLFPDLRGFLPFAGPEHTLLRIAGNVLRLFTEGLGENEIYFRRGWNVIEPNGYAMGMLRWLDLGGCAGGLSMFHKRWGDWDKPVVRTQRTAANPMSARIMWDHLVPAPPEADRFIRAAIEPGQSWESGEFILTPHRGGWAKGIEVFRDYVSEVNPQRPIPRHVKEGLGLRSVWMSESMERDPSRAYFRFEDLAKAARDAKDHGLDELVVWAWNDFFVLPLEVRKELGSLEELLAGVREAKAMGVNVSLFVSVQTLRDGCAERYGVKPERAHWVYHSEYVPPIHSHYAKAWKEGWIDSENAQWQRDVEASFREWFDRGVRSFCWDQLATHRSASGGRSTFLSLIERLRNVARSGDPESTFSGEAVSLSSFEADGAVLDYTWNWTYEYADAGPVLNVLRVPRPNIHVERSALVAKKCFCDGLYINAMPTKPDCANGSALIGEVPELAAALKECAARRSQFLPYFVDGLFIGDSVLAEPADGFIRGRLLDGRLLICALNDDEKCSRRIVFRADLDLWLPAARTRRVRSYNASGNLQSETHTRNGVWRAATRLLSPCETAFFEVEGADGVEPDRAAAGVPL